MDSVVVAMSYWINWITSLWIYLKENWTLSAFMRIIVLNFAFKYIHTIKKVFK